MGMSGGDPMADQELPPGLFSTAALAIKGR